MNKIWEKFFKKLVKKIYFIFGEKSKKYFSKMTKKNQKCCFLQKIFENESSAAQNPKNRKKYFFKFVIRKCQKSNFFDFFACQEMKISKIIFFWARFFHQKISCTSTKYKNQFPNYNFHLDNSNICWFFSHKILWFLDEKMSK